MQDWKTDAFFLQGLLTEAHERWNSFKCHTQNGWLQLLLNINAGKNSTLKDLIIIKTQVSTCYMLIGT